MKNAPVFEPPARARAHALAGRAGVLKVTWIPESSEVSAPTELELFSHRSELIEPPARDTIAGEAVNVDVERVTAQVPAA